MSEQDEFKAEEVTSIQSSELPTQPYDGSKMESHIPPSNLHSFQIGTGSSVGRQREHNEDALFAMSTNLVTNRVALPVGLFIVADGMGGHAHGEKASELAIQGMVSSVLPELAPYTLGLVEEIKEKKLREIMERGIHTAHDSIQENAAGGGSTLTALLLVDEILIIAHIGDSRAYHFDGEYSPRILTTDHSLVKRLEDLGQITADEAAIHPQRNVLYRALGQVEHVDAEIISTVVPSSGYLVVCSDGLWGEVPGEEIARIISKSSSPQQASQALLAAANAAGGPDNISVIIIKVLENT